MLLEVFFAQNREKLVSALTWFSRDYDAAEDAVQNAFLKLIQQRDILSTMQDKSLWSWLYTTAKNALIDEKRKISRVQPIDDYDEADPAGDFTDTIAIKDVLNRLPPKLMQIVSMRYYGGLNATEIGRLKGIPPSTVRTQLRAAMQILRKLID